MMSNSDLSWKAVVSGILCIFALVVWSGTADSAEKAPVARYWMSVSTEKSGFPGMPSGAGGGMSGVIGGMLGMGGGVVRERGLS